MSTGEPPVTHIPCDRQAVLPRGMPPLKSKRNIHIFISLLFPLVSLLIGLLYGHFSFAPEYQINAHARVPPQSDLSTVVLNADLISANLMDGFLVLNWTIRDVKCARPAQDCSPVNVYLQNISDFYASSDDGQLLTRKIQSRPSLTYPSMPEIGDLPGQNTVEIVVERSLQLYPFDKYFSNVILFAQDSNTSDTVYVDVTFTAGFFLCLHTYFNALGYRISFCVPFTGGLQ
jgi:hypothetical protein